MKARIEIDFVKFNRQNKNFAVVYDLYEKEIFLFKDTIIFNLPRVRKTKEAFYWLQVSHYEFYKQIEVEIPFESIEFKYKRFLKNMGVDPYE